MKASSKILIQRNEQSLNFNSFDFFDEMEYILSFQNFGDEFIFVRRTTAAWFLNYSHIFATRIERGILCLNLFLCFSACEFL